jgi:P27 family predicted phage terminase small subunit
MAEQPAAPEHLSARSRRLWSQTLADFELEPTELETLRMALEARDRAEQARKVLRREGLTYTDRFGAPHAHPAAAIERDSRAAWLRLTAALSLPVDDDDQPKLDHRSRAAKARRFRSAA